MSNSVRFNQPIKLVPAPGVIAASGRRIIATGKRGPLFASQPADCGDCNDFQTVMVRDGRRLSAVDCHCVTPAALAG